MLFVADYLLFIIFIYSIVSGQKKQVVEDSIYGHQVDFVKHTSWASFQHLVPFAPKLRQHQSLLGSVIRLFPSTFLDACLYIHSSMALFCNFEVEALVFFVHDY